MGRVHRAVTVGSCGADGSRPAMRIAVHGAGFGGATRRAFVDLRNQWSSERVEVLIEVTRLAYFRQEDR